MRNSKAVKVRDVQIGGGAPVVVQSMTKTDTSDVAGTVAQIGEMVRAGCEVVRLAVPDDAAAAALPEIRRRVPEVPLVADIHFHYKLALKAVAAGVDKLRLNPGNIGSIERVREVVRATQERGIPIRIGVNGGSLEKDLLRKYGTATPEAMCESALRHIRILEDLNFTDIIISLKASDVHRTVAAYRLLAAQVDYPLHLGVTEAGTSFGGTIKSAMGLGILLHDAVTRQQLVNTFVDYGAPLPTTGDPETFDRVLAAKQAEVSDVFVSLVTKAPAVDIALPLTRNGRVRYLLKLALSFVAACEHEE